MTKAAPRRTIGSVLPLPEDTAAPPGEPSLWAAWTDGWPHLAAFRTARSALAALLRQRRIRRVWLPAYACAALAEAAVGCEVVWYGVDAHLAPEIGALADGLAPGDAALGIDYFGAAPPPGFRALAMARPDVLWIEDRAQALAPDAPAWGEVVLYSPRKLLGVPDGGLMVSRTPLPAPAALDGPVSAAAQLARRDDPLGERPQTWFPQFQAQEAAFQVDDQPMSGLTRRLLAQAPADPLAAARADNYAFLAERLAAYALWPGGRPAFAPLAFPVRLAERDAAVAAMAEAGIYCARHWAELACDPDAYPAARALSETLLSLPCDYRYGLDDMARVADRLQAVARPAS